MNKYLLDTNICVYLLNGKYGLEDKIREVGHDSCYISSVTFLELLYGAEKSKRKVSNTQVIQEFVKDYEIIPFEVAMQEFAKQKVYLQSIGRPVGDFDILIGSTAIELGMILVTRNVKDFINMQGIQVENWIDDA